MGKNPWKALGAWITSGPGPLDIVTRLSFMTQKSEGGRAREMTNDTVMYVLLSCSVQLILVRSHITCSVQYNKIQYTHRKLSLLTVQINMTDPLNI